MSAVFAYTVTVIVVDRLTDLEERVPYNNKFQTVIIDYWLISCNAQIRVLSYPTCVCVCHPQEPDVSVCITELQP